jgi:hypothetical protein
MRQRLAIWALAIYGLAMVGPLLPYVEYAVNKQYIAEQLCENIDRPELNCLGQCYLNDRLESLNRTADLGDPATPLELEQVDYDPQWIPNEGVLSLPGQLIAFLPFIEAITDAAPADLLIPPPQFA